MIDWNEVLTTIVGGLCVSALLALTAWLAGKLTPTGRTFWMGLGPTRSKVTFFMATFAVVMSIFSAILSNSRDVSSSLAAVEDEIYTTPPFFAARNPGSLNFQTNPSCPLDYEVTGYYCEVTDGFGSLVNVGLASSTTAHCAWTAAPDANSFAAFGLAICKRIPGP